MNLQLNNSDSYHPIYKLIDSIRLMGRMRSIEWFSRYLTAGKIYDVPKENSELILGYIDSISTIMPLLDKKFGKNWDFHLQPRFVDSYGDELDCYVCPYETANYDNLKFVGFVVQIVLLYPSIEIKDKHDNSHMITDLFVIIPIKIRNSSEYESPIHFGGELFGTRGTVSLEESYIGYRHSHLTTTTMFNRNSNHALGLDEFCLGDNEVANLLSTFSGEGYSQNMFELFLLTLDTFVAWESREGGPYVNMTDIAIGEMSPIRTSTSGMAEEYSNMKRWISRLTPEEYDIDFIVFRDRFKIKLNSKFEKFLIKILHSQMYNSNYMCVKRDGNYYKETTDAYEIQTMSKNYWEDYDISTVIQGKKIQYKIKEITGERPENQELGLHPKYIKYVSEQLEKEIYRKTIRQGTISKYQADNATAVSR